MSGARERILARLRAATPAPVPPLADVGAWYAARQRDEDAVQRVSRLRSALEAAHAEVHETSVALWRECLFESAARKGLRNLLVGAGTAQGAALDKESSGRLEIIAYAQAIENWRETLFNGIDAGFSIARSAVAETGSLIVWTGAAEPRLMSLVPPLHFVLLDSRTIHADLHSAMIAEGWQRGLPTNVLVISGPSKTADIQQTLAYGAHGPRELVVLITRDEGGEK